MSCRLRKKVKDLSGSDTEAEAERRLLLTILSLLNLKVMCTQEPQAADNQRG